MNRKRLLIVSEQPQSPGAEAYRIFRTNIQFSKVGSELKTILFTSSCAGEGKSISAANTAIALAQSGKKVILLDCDLRRPVQQTLFDKIAIGLTNILCDGISPNLGIQETNQENLYLVTSGPIPPNPSELLSSIKFNETLTYLKTKADYLIIDSPPILPVSDACVLTSKVDGTILVVGAGIVRLDMAQSAKEAIERAKGSLLGVMVNRVGIVNSDYYGYCNETKRRKIFER